MTKSKYTKTQFKADIARLSAIVGKKFEYLGSAPNTYRVTYGIEDLQIYLDVFLSKRTVVIRNGRRTPRYFRALSWDELNELFTNLGNFIWG